MRRLPGMPLGGLLAVLASSPASAHGPEGHGGPAAGAAELARRPAAAATGDVFEVVARLPPSAPGTAVEVLVLVAETATNAPVEGAAVALTLTAATEVRTAARATATPGIYTAAVTLPAAGDWDAVASISRGADADLVALGPLRAGLPPAPAIPPHEHPAAVPARTLVFVVAGALGVGALVALVRRLRRRSEASTGAGDA